MDVLLPMIKNEKIVSSKPNVVDTVINVVFQHTK